MNKVKPSLIVIGAGGHARVVHDCAVLQGYEVLFFVDETDARPTSLEGIPVLPAVPEESAGHFFVAIGDNVYRKTKFDEMISRGLQPAKLVHPASVVSKSSSISDGTIICAGAVVGPNARVGSNCIVNTCASVDHDCEVLDHAHIAVGVRLCGTVEIGEGALIGAGATVIQRISIGAWSILGAGTIVIKNVGSHKKFVGNPARDITRS